MKNLLCVTLILMSYFGLGHSKYCYACTDCVNVDTTVPTVSCPASCLSTVICDGYRVKTVSRMCSSTNEPQGCMNRTNSANCYCNYDRCDALLGRNPCNNATNSVVSLSLVALTMFVAKIFHNPL
ncbi:uncharacterized protein [Penaeus vannamei]|uniref:Uncharacterized protein n=1 Tax=Penaeus vannamei TaxID=6689 RepID=A0A423TQ96_PENVA|nr:uncharacterized protein LOC113802941 [Penaeus vannamei]XP_027209415.1 uncharacterized protein LOC113802941 [Penaeus vannamei]ROT78582.1 hypothetical protein C7M84_002700 [Penaeus vannamei]